MFADRAVRLFVLNLCSQAVVLAVTAMLPGPALALAGAASARLEVDQPAIVLGTADPRLPAIEKSPALTVRLTSDRAWELTLVAEDNFADVASGGQVPSERLSVRPHGEQAYRTMSPFVERIIAAGGPTVEESRSYDLDVRLAVQWEDAPGSYRTPLRLNLLVGGRPAASRAVDVRFDIGPAVELQAQVSTINFGRAKPVGVPPALRAPIETLATLSDAELAKRLGVLASKELAGGYRAIVRSNVPWALSAQVMRRFEEAGHAADGPAPKLPASRISVRRPTGEYARLSDQAPVVVVTGRPTSSEGMAISLDVRVEFQLLDPVGLLEGTLSFAVQNITPS